MIHHDIQADLHGLARGIAGTLRMPKASLTLPNGTVVSIEGTIPEIEKLLKLYGSGSTNNSPQQTRLTAESELPASSETRSADFERNSTGSLLAEIVNHVKSCDEAELLESRILDGKSQVDRTLLPLYIVHNHYSDQFGLSTGEINKITTDLGVPVATSNAAKTLAGPAAPYVIGDRVRVKGRPVRYKLSRRGVRYMEAIIKRANPTNDLP